MLKHFTCYGLWFRTLLGGILLLALACSPKIQAKVQAPEAEKVVKTFMQSFSAKQLEAVIALVGFPFWGGDNLFHSPEALKPIIGYGNQQQASGSDFKIEQLTFYRPGGVDGVPERVNHKALHDFQGREVLIAEMKYQEARQSITGYIFVYQNPQGVWKVVGLMD